MATGQQVARVGDVCTGTCTAHPTPRPFTAIIATGSPTSRADGQSIACVGSVGSTDCGHTIEVVSGSAVARADGIPIARIGDVVIVVEGGDGIIVSGSPTTTSL
ncbi:MAG TPA: hypothetical protein VFM18_05305 [Methanosarcina sp.]|nr:hypothetical protein [Methanosarcina sp.]